MKAPFLVLLLLSSSTLIVAQRLPEWYRVYTFDESIIEMNRPNVIVDFAADRERKLLTVPAA